MTTRQQLDFSHHRPALFTDGFRLRFWTYRLLGAIHDASQDGRWFSHVKVEDGSSSERRSWWQRAHEDAGRQGEALRECGAVWLRKCPLAGARQQKRIDKPPHYGLESEPGSDQLEKNEIVRLKFCCRFNGRQPHMIIFG